MSDHDVQYSTEFPSGYGDLELKLSDNVIFSFPRGILAHVSPVFKDMFSIGDTNDQREPLALTEASNTIKEFLLYIDPLKYSRGFTLDTVESLLEAATKYKVAAMVEIFEKWAVRGPSYIYIYHDTSGPSERDDSYPIKSNPMLFLSLAERFDFSEIGGISIRDAVLADKTCISISKYPLGCTTTIQLMELRIERIKILTEKLGRSIRAEMDKIQPRWGSSLPSQSRQTHHPPPSAFCGQTNLTKNASGCLECLRKLCDLVVDLPMRLHDQPMFVSRIYGEL